MQVKAINRVTKALKAQEQVAKAFRFTQQDLIDKLNKINGMVGNTEQMIGFSFQRNLKAIESMVERMMDVRTNAVEMMTIQTQMVNIVRMIRDFGGELGKAFNVETFITDIKRKLAQGVTSATTPSAATQPGQKAIGVGGIGSGLIPLGTQPPPPPKPPVDGNPFADGKSTGKLG